MLIDIATGRKKRELDWIVNETLDVLREFKHSLDDCYALLAPIDPGSTLVVSTQRNERVKGHVTRIGTRIVKATINIQLRTAAPLTLMLHPTRSIHIPELAAIHTYLTQCIDLVGLVLACPASATALAAQLRVLSHALAESVSLLKTGRSPSGMTHAECDWTVGSCSPEHFAPAAPSHISLHMSLQDSGLVLALRVLESAHGPVNLSTKLGLVIGTVRRIEHDEMDTVFAYRPDGTETGSEEGPNKAATGKGSGSGSETIKSKSVDVFVREKVRVESADPSLISLSAKLSSLAHSLMQARRNLAAVLNEDVED